MFTELFTGQYLLCKGISLPEINFVKHVIPKKCDLQQPLHQDKYFRSKSCKLLVLPSKNKCKNCHAENIKSKGKLNLENLF